MLVMLWMIIGFFVGTIAGLIVTALVFTANNADTQIKHATDVYFSKNIEQQGVNLYEQQ